MAGQELREKTPDKLQLDLERSATESTIIDGAYKMLEEVQGVPLTDHQIKTKLADPQFRMDGKTIERAAYHFKQAQEAKKQGNDDAFYYHNLALFDAMTASVDKNKVISYAAERIGSPQPNNDPLYTFKFTVAAKGVDINTIPATVGRITPAQREQFSAEAAKLLHDAQHHHLNMRIATDPDRRLAKYIDQQYTAAAQQAVSPEKQKADFAQSFVNASATYTLYKATQPYAADVELSFGNKPPKSLWPFVETAPQLLIKQMQQLETSFAPHFKLLRDEAHPEKPIAPLAAFLAQIDQYETALLPDVTPRERTPVAPTAPQAAAPNKKDAPPHRHIPQMPDMPDLGKIFPRIGPARPDPAPPVPAPPPKPLPIIPPAGEKRAAPPPPAAYKTPGLLDPNPAMPAPKLGDSAPGGRNGPAAPIPSNNGVQPEPIKPLWKGTPSNRDDKNTPPAPPYRPFIAQAMEEDAYGELSPSLQRGTKGPSTSGKPGKGGGTSLA